MAISKIGSDALAAGAPSRSQLPAGTVLQVVQSTKTTATSTTSTSFVDAGLSASITPTSSTNKILVLVSGIAYASGGGFTYTTLYRGTTTNLGQASGFVKATGGNSQPMPFNYLDSPATTSSVTYNVYIAGSGTTSYFGESGFACTITLMEIAA